MGWLATRAPPSMLEEKLADDPSYHGINAGDKHGWTLLHFAAAAGAKEHVGRILAFLRGSAATESCNEKELVNKREKLQGVGLSPGATRRRERRLDGRASRGQRYALERMSELRAWIAAKHVEILRLLIDHEGDLDQKDMRGDTPRAMASRHCGVRANAIRAIVDSSRRRA